jgi:hypothetical protein
LFAFPKVSSFTSHNNCSDSTHKFGRYEYRWKTPINKSYIRETNPCMYLSSHQWC